MARKALVIPAMFATVLESSSRISNLQDSQSAIAFTKSAAFLPILSALMLLLTLALGGNRGIRQKKKSPTQS
jgi:hypothetical protein